MDFCSCSSQHSSLGCLSLSLSERIEERESECECESRGEERNLERERKGLICGKRRKGREIFRFLA